MIWFSDENIDIEMIIKESICSSDQENDENEIFGGKNQLASEGTIKKETVAINKNNFKCLHCEEILSRKSNFNRHFDRKHL